MMRNDGITNSGSIGMTSEQLEHVNNSFAAIGLRFEKIENLIVKNQNEIKERFLRMEKNHNEIKKQFMHMEEILNDKFNSSSDTFNSSSDKFDKLSEQTARWLILMKIICVILIGILFGEPILQRILN